MSNVDKIVTVIGLSALFVALIVCAVVATV